LKILAVVTTIAKSVQDAAKSSFLSEVNIAWILPFCMGANLQNTKVSMFGEQVFGGPFWSGWAIGCLLGVCEQTWARPVQICVQEVYFQRLDTF
jgi:hypothetical protein